MIFLYLTSIRGYINDINVHVVRFRNDIGLAFVHGKLNSELTVTTINREISNKIHPLGFPSFLCSPCTHKHGGKAST